MNEVPVAVRELVRERILALEQLEILLLLRQRPESWSLDELALRLSMQTMLVEAAAAHLHHHGLIADDVHGRYRYAPSEPLAELVEALAFSYANTRAELLGLISSDAVSRVRRRARLLMRRLSDRPEPL